jgi:hypothetical protein
MELGRFPFAVFLATLAYGPPLAAVGRLQAILSEYGFGLHTADIFRDAW